MPRRLRIPPLAGCLFAALACLLPSAALAATGGSGAGARSTRGGSPTDPRVAAAQKGKIVGGPGLPPAGAPPEVVAVINAANQIVRMPYRYGGGHQDFMDS